MVAHPRQLSQSAIAHRPVGQQTCENGEDVERATSTHRIGIKESRYLSRAVDLLCDIVFCSEYPQHEIEHEIDVICDEIESYNDSPAELIYDEFENLIFRGHPLGHNILGTRLQVQQFTSTDARRFTQRYYPPDNAIFFVYGDIDFDRMVKMLEKKVNVEWNMRTPDIPPLRENSQLSSLIATPHSQRENSQLSSPSHHQAHVMLGVQTFSYDDPRRMPLFLLNNMLGGPGMNARLNLSLRERNGLVYTVESSQVSYSDTGCWSVYFGCDHHDVKRCLRLVHRELGRLMQHPLSERQLQAAKRQLKGQLAIACDNREQFALDFAKHFLHYGRERSIDELLQRVEAITSAQIQNVAQELFAPDKLQVLTL